MLKTTNLPSGISLSTNNSGTVTTTNGLGSSINLIASNESTNVVSASITIPAGIKMKDASNTLLA